MVTALVGFIANGFRKRLDKNDEEHEVIEARQDSIVNNYNQKFTDLTRVVTDESKELTSEIHKSHIALMDAIDKKIN